MLIRSTNALHIQVFIKIHFLKGVLMYINFFNRYSPYFLQQLV